MHLPPVWVRIGPAGSGKTHNALSRCGPGCWLVVPSESTVRLLQNQAQGGTVSTFRGLAGAITGLDPEGIASPALRAFLLREAVRESVQPGSYFAAAAERPGFAPAIGELIREFKQAQVTPGRFGKAAAAAAPSVDDPRFLEKCESIRAIWLAYDSLLRANSTLDADDVLALAIEQAQSWKYAPATLIVDGFTTFTAQQLSLLAALQQRGTGLEICLTGDPARGVLFARTTRTLEELRSYLEPLQEEHLTGRARHQSAASLRHLERHLFDPSNPQPCDESVTIFDAPDPVMEAEMVARAVHRLHREGTPLSRIAIVQRRLGGAATLLLSTFARYGIPVAFGAGVPLMENPLVSLIASLLRIFLLDWPRSEVLRCARSSYFGLPPEEVDHLERRAISRGVHRGRAAWLKVFGPTDSHGKLFEWMDRLRAHQDKLQQPRDPTALAQRICEMVDDFGLPAAAERGDAALARQDTTAWRSAKGLLEEVGRVETLAGEQGTSFAQLAEAILSSWQSGLFEVPAPEEEHVHILEAFDARQQEFDAVFLMALNERVFPRVAADDPFLRDDEREALEACGLRLTRQVDRADEERVLFYRVVTAPSERLILSYARTSSDGRQALPSYYLEEVRSVFTEGKGGPRTVVRTLADAVPDIADAVGLREKVLCATAAIAGHRPLPEQQREALVAELAAEKPDLFADLQAFLRECPEPRLAKHALRVWARGQVSARAFSASELETYIACPFRHFLHYQLYLREVSEEADAANVGSLLHAVLRRFFASWRAEAGADSALLPDDALPRMEAILDELLGDYVRDPRPSRMQMTRHAAREYLARFLERERAHLERTGLVPTCFELAFGPQPSYQNSEPDPKSRETPLRISVPEDPADPGQDHDILIAGRIDRVDLMPDGKAAVVTDYKLSRVSPLREMFEGTSLQVPVYFLAMEKVFGLPTPAVIQHPLRKGEPHWTVRTMMEPRLTPGRGDGLCPARYAELVEVACNAIVAAATGIRNAAIPPQPGDACTLCPFTDVCRRDDSMDDAGTAQGSSPES